MTTEKAAWSTSTSPPDPSDPPFSITVGRSDDGNYVVDGHFRGIEPFNAVRILVHLAMDVLEYAPCKALVSLGEHFGAMLGEMERHMTIHDHGAWGEPPDDETVAP